MTIIQFLQIVAGLTKCNRQLLKIVVGIAKPQNSHRYYNDDKNVLQSVTSITDCNRKLLQTAVGIAKGDSHYFAGIKYLTFPGTL